MTHKASVPLVESGYAVLLASAFVLPAWIAYRAWIPALALATLLAALRGWLGGRRPLLPAAMLAYLGVYAVAGVHSDPDTFSMIEAGKYFAPPIFALAVAWGCSGNSAARKRIVFLGFVAVAIQLPVVIVQVIQLLADFGHDATNQVDQIIGLIGDGQGGPLTQSALVAAALLLAAVYVGRLSRRLGLTAALLAIGIGLLTSTRASYLFVPAMVLALAAALWLAVRRGAVTSLRPWTAAAIAVIIVPVLYFGTGALYPGANETLDSVNGVSATLQNGDQQLAGGPQTGGPGQAATPAPEAPLTVLPGRGRQMTLALELSVDDGVDVAVLGRGIGATRFKDQDLLSATGSTSDPITRPEQKTNAVWIARTISETGYLGLLAFLGLLGYLVVLWWRNIDILAERSWDAATMFALPGIAALTLVSAAYNTILAVQPYATLFWALLGVAIAIDAERRSRTA